MQILLKIGLAAFIVYLPIMLWAIWYVKAKHPNHSIFSSLISHLGQKESPKRKIFNLAISLYGFLGLFFTISLSQILPGGWLAVLGLVSMYAVRAGCMLIGILPRDEWIKSHAISAYCIFFGVLGVTGFFIWPIYLSDLFPNGLILLNLIILTTMVLHIIGDLAKSYHQISGRSVIMARYLIDRWTFWEWAMFILAVCWDFIAALITFNNLL